MKAVIFDMDGVIVDSEPIYNKVHADMLREFGITEFLDCPEDYTGMTSIAVFTKTRELYQLKQTIAEIAAYQRDIIIREIKKLEDEPIAGIRELLASLKKHKIKTAIASSSERLFINTVVDKFGLHNYFDVIVSGDDIEKSKPAPDIFLKAAHLLCVEPANCLVIEDSKSGTIAAKAAAMKCVGFANPNSGKQDLSQADKIISSIHEINILEYIKTLNFK